MNRVLPLPPEGHTKVMRQHGDSFRQFMRNGVWGTCSCCPRDTDNHAYPEFCKYALRTDHTLTSKELFEHYQALAR